MEKLARMDKEAPLPAGLAARVGGWSARAQQYPVFSKTWYVYRLRSFRAPMILLVTRAFHEFVLLKDLELSRSGAERHSGSVAK